MEEILKYRIFNDERFGRAGVWTHKSNAKRHAEVLRRDGFKVRTVKVPSKNGIKYANYIRKS